MIAELFSTLLEDAETRLKPNTLKQYRTAANTIVPAFAEFTPSQVRPCHIAEFMDHHKGTPNMANRMRSLLKMVFEKAVVKGLCDINPVISVPRFSEKKRDRYLADDEFIAIHKSGSETLKVIMDIAYLTGQRIGDVLSIRLSDISENGVFFKQEKTGKRLSITMTPTLERVIDRAKKLHGKIPRFYLLGLHSGKKRSYRGVRDLFNRAVIRANIEDAHLHDIRAKSITDAKREGLNAQLLAGHTTEAQTNRYIRDRSTDIASGPKDLSFKQCAIEKH